MARCSFLPTLVTFGSFGHVGVAAGAAPASVIAALSTSVLVASTTVFVIFLLDLDQYWIVAAASFLSGVVWTTDMPLRRRLLGDIAGIPHTLTLPSRSA